MIEPYPDYDSSLDTYPYESGYSGMVESDYNGRELDD